VIATVEQEHYRRAVPERCECVEEGLAEELRRPGAPSVQQGEKPVAMPPRHDTDLVEILVHVPAVEREADEPRSAGRVVSRAPAAAGGQYDERR
jgi:hypothetical protein